jgi:hypothetical protein
MQKKILIIITLLNCYNCFAQTQFSIFAGPQAVSARYTVNDTKQPNQYKYGLEAGINWKIPFDVNLFFAPAIYYSMKGYKVTLNDAAFPPSLFAKNNDARLHAFDFAPLLQYDFGKHPSHLFIRIGPAVDVIFSGNEEFDLSTGETISRKMKFTFGDYGRFTSNVIVHLGYESLTGFIIFAHYTYGLGSLNNADGGPKIKHRIFGLSVGKYLRKKRKE